MWGWARGVTPTAGNAYSEEEAQPFYVNAPFRYRDGAQRDIANAHSLRAELFQQITGTPTLESDWQVLLNVFAHELERATRVVYRCSLMMSSRRCVPCTGGSRVPMP